MLHNVLGQLEFLLRVIVAEDLFECQSDHSIKSLSCSIQDGHSDSSHDLVKQKSLTIQWIAILPSRCNIRHLSTLSCFQPQVTRWSYNRWHAEVIPGPKAQDLLWHFVEKSRC